MWMWIGWLHWFPPLMSVVQTQLLSLALNARSKKKSRGIFMMSRASFQRWPLFFFLSFSFISCAHSVSCFAIFMACCDNIMAASAPCHCITWMENMIIREYLYMLSAHTRWNANGEQVKRVYFSNDKTKHITQYAISHSLTHFILAGWYTPIRKHYFIWQRCSNKTTLAKRWNKDTGERERTIHVTWMKRAKDRHQPIPLCSNGIKLTTICTE